MFYNILLELCEKKNIRITNLLIEFNLSTANTGKWKNGSYPSIDVLKKLADYFNVSIDYLIGRTIENIANTPEEIEIIKTYRLLNNDYKQSILKAVNDARTQMLFDDLNSREKAVAETGESITVTWPKELVERLDKRFGDIGK